MEPPPAFSSSGTPCLMPRKRAFGVDVNLAVPRFFGGFFHSVAGAGAGVVDQYVEGSVGGHGGGHGVDPVLFTGDVQLDENGVAAGGANLLGSALAVLGVDVAQHDFGAFAGRTSGPPRRRSPSTRPRHRWPLR